MRIPPQVQPSRLLSRSATQATVLAFLAVSLTLSIPGKADPTSSLDALRARVEAFTEPTVNGVQIFDLKMNVDELELDNVSEGHAKPSVWSGDYWPLRHGSIAGEYGSYGNRENVGNDGWRDVLSKFRRKWRRMDPRNLSAQELARLSPAEKLDVVLSDYKMTLSNQVWKSIEEQGERAGDIKSWEGVCHGWASAAIMAPRPVRTVSVRSRDGRYDVQFTPTDIKALASYLWGKSLIQDYTRFEGNRCDNKRPRFDPLTGVSEDPNCQGVDPAVFHLSLVNLMGRRHESFIINKNTDTEVWNQPLDAYEYRYFNVETGKSGTLARSIVPVEELSSNIRRRKRAPETRFLLGIDMTLTYVKERSPDTDNWNSATRDNLKELRYIYDLELDENHNVIGGEWRNYRTDRETRSAYDTKFPGYPGFIWKIQRSQVYAQSVDDDGGPEWEVGQPIPESFVERQRQAATFRYQYWDFDADGKMRLDPQGAAIVISTELKPQPLGTVVRGLLRAAKTPKDRRTLTIPSAIPAQTSTPSQVPAVTAQPVNAQ